jgi:hypothetical protein
MTVKIVRFKDGLDVICNYSSLLDNSELTEPMMFEIRNSSLIMQHWLPVPLIKDNYVVVKNVDILCTFDPNEDLSEYYTETVRKMKEVVKKTKEESQEDLTKLMEILNELDNTKGIKIH